MGMRSLGVLLAIASSPYLIAQTTLPTEFEVATIRLRTEASEVSRVNLRPGGRIEASNVTLTRLIAGAYDVTEQQIVDGPSWREEVRWDLEAKAEGLPSGAGPGEVLPLLRKLLENRFHLKVRREMRPMPVYQLLVERNGPSANLKPSTTEGLDAASNYNGPKGMKMDAARMHMPGFAQRLSRYVGRPVVDRTGLTGRYDFTLEWVPEMAATVEGEAAGPSVFTAVRETLGLRLESGRDLVEVLVVERVERPTEN
jgi:uncharacterized protein (TIGR03435 family)